MRAESKGISPRKVIPLGPRQGPSRTGVVYLLKYGTHFKIGKSTSPHERYRRLNIQLPKKADLVHEIQTDDIDYVEKHWHRRFASVRENGEWFSLNSEDVSEFIQCKRMLVSCNKAEREA